MKYWLFIVVSTSLLLVSCQSVEQPKTLRVITSGGFAQAYKILEPQFEKETGIDLVTSFGSSSGGAPDSIPERLKRGEAFDIIILSQSSLNRQTGNGYVIPELRRDIVKSSIGMAVKSGAPKPDISTTATFLAALFDAKSIGYSASASGTYLSTKLFPKLGIWQRLKDKSKRILSERVASVVARGEVEIGFQQVSEILSISGTDYVGPIPDEYQKVTVFSMGILKDSANIEDAKLLLAYLTSNKVADTIAKTGLQPIAYDK